MVGRATFLCLAIGCAVIAAVHGELRWKVVNAQIARKFPDVPTISTAELAPLLEPHDAAPRPLLLDVRTSAEFEVSHLAGAQRVEPGTALKPGDIRAAKDAPIVTYCSVGYRSAEFARSLRAAGFTNVRNLSGSIFQWANEDRPLVRGTAGATTVHPYDRFWGALLKKERRAQTGAPR